MRLRDFGRFGYKDKTLEDYGPLIELLLEDLGYSYPDDYKAFNGYYLAFNPLIPDKNTMSAKIHTRDGILLSYNGCIDVTRQGIATSSNSITCSEYCKLLNRTDLYIEFILSSYDVDLSILREYKLKLVDFTMMNINEIDYATRRGMENFRKFLFCNFITDVDVFNYKAGFKTLGNLKQQFKREAKPKFDRPTTTFEKPMPFSEKMILKYMEKRKINVSENVYPTMVCIKQYKIPAIAFEYPNGFRKLRYIEESSSRRYQADGEYACLFEAQVNKKSDTCYLCEGEIEGCTIANIIDDDVYSLHSVSSIPKNLDQLSSYKNIIIKLDYDKYESVKNIFLFKFTSSFPDKNIKVEPKFISDDKNIDYNYFYCNNSLTKDMIYNVYNF